MDKTQRYVIGGAETFLGVQDVLIIEGKMTIYPVVIVW